MILNTPQIEPISSVRDHKRLLEKATHRGPVFLAQRSKPVAVFVTHEDWEKIVAKMKILETEVLRQRLHANSTTPDVSYDEFITDLLERDAEYAVAD